MYTVKFTLNLLLDTTVVPVSSTNNDDDDMVSIIVISILAIIGTLLIIIIILETVILLLHKRKMSNNDHNPHKDIHNITGQSKHDHSNEGVLSQGVKVDPAASELETSIVNELYITNKVDHSRSIPSVSGCDVTITPNPSYVIDANLLQTGNKPGQYDYEYVQSNELDQHYKLQLARSTISDGAYDDTVTDPVSDDYDDAYI